MTRKDVVNSYGYKVAKASVDYSQKYAKDDELQSTVMDTFEDAAKFGYGLAVEEACEWLDKNLVTVDHDIIYNGLRTRKQLVDEYIKNFRKAMKGE